MKSFYLLFIIFRLSLRLISLGGRLANLASRMHRRYLKTTTFTFLYLLSLRFPITSLPPFLLATFWHHLFFKLLPLFNICIPSPLTFTFYHYRLSSPFYYKAFIYHHLFISIILVSSILYTFYNNHLSVTTLLLLLLSSYFLTFPRSYLPFSYPCSLIFLLNFLCSVYPRRWGSDWKFTPPSQYLPAQDNFLPFQIHLLSNHSHFCSFPSPTSFPSHLPPRSFPFLHTSLLLPSIPPSYPPSRSTSLESLSTSGFISSHSHVTDVHASSGDTKTIFKYLLINANIMLIR